LRWLGRGALVKSWTSKNGVTGYRKYADGWIEQWGRVNGVQYNNGTTNVSFPVRFKTANYSPSATAITTLATDTCWNIAARCSDLTTTTMRVVGGANNNGYWGGAIAWKAEGY